MNFASSEIFQKAQMLEVIFKHLLFPDTLKPVKMLVEANNLCLEYNHNIRVKFWALLT